MLLLLLERVEALDVSALFFWRAVQSQLEFEKARAAAIGGGPG